MMSSVASLAGQCAARLSFTSGSSVCLACSSSENLVAHQQQGGSEACGAVNQGAKALRLPNACSEPALHMASIAESCCAAAPGTWRKVAAHTQLCVGDHVTLLVTEWADCGSLSRAIACGVYSTCPGQSMQQSSSRRRYRALLRTARDVAQGLDHLHAEGITHGDIRPGSVLLRGCRADARGFTARLTNLCRAQHTHSGDLPLPLPASHHHYSHLRPAAAQLHPLPPTQAARGPAPHALRYSAPEAVRGQLQPASDVWSWAVVVWHMASGQLPFDGLTEEEVTQGVAAGQLRLVWPAGVSPALGQLVQQCLQPDPRLRPSAAFLVAALVAEELEVRRAASSGSQQRPRWHQ
ncbi:kinase-like domain-containing protein [Haematococcus lacustris]